MERVAGFEVLEVGVIGSLKLMEMEDPDIAVIGSWRSGIAPLSCGGVINNLLEGIDGVAIEFSGVVLNNNGFTGANGC